MRDRAVIQKVKAQRGKRTPLKCRVCGWHPAGGLARSLLHAHHVVPRAAGGPDEPSNLVVLCPNHHAVAHALWPASRAGVYEGPRIPADMVWLLRAFEDSPEAYYEAKLHLAVQVAERSA